MSKLTFRDKINILNQIDSGQKQYLIASENSVTSSAISRIKKNREKIRNLIPTDGSRKRIDSYQVKKRDDLIVSFVNECNTKGFPINARIIKAKAMSLFGNENEPFKASNGWFNKMKRRTSLKYLKVKRGIESVDREQVDAILRFQDHGQSSSSSHDSDDSNASPQIYNPQQSNGDNDERVSSPNYRPLEPERLSTNSFHDSSRTYSHKPSNGCNDNQVPSKYWRPW